MWARLMWIEELMLSAPTSRLPIPTSLKGIRIECDLLLTPRALSRRCVHTRRPMETSSILGKALGMVQMGGLLGLTVVQGMCPGSSMWWLCVRVWAVVRWRRSDVAT